MKIILACLAVLALAQAFEEEIDWSTVRARHVYPKVPLVRLPAGGRIVGGNEAQANSIPYQIGLLITTPGGTFFCGGSLISRTTVLTAAHCVEDGTSIQVRLGAHYINNLEDSQIRITTSSYTIHSGWDMQTLRDDIALVHLPEPVDLNDNVQLIGLAGAGDGDFAGDIGRISGWGMDSDQANGISPVLRFVNAPVMTNAGCSNTFGSYITDRHVCTDGRGGLGSCSGDSGGPLVYNGKQVGIVSFGAAAGCELGYPSAFTRVSEFADWIESNSDAKVH